MSQNHDTRTSGGSTTSTKGSRQGTTGAVRLIRSTDRRAVRDPTQTVGGEENTTPNQQINHITPEDGPETTYPSADWDVVSINRQLV